MADYGRVARRFWTDPKVRRWPDDARLLGLYLLTAPHGALEGYYRLPLNYVSNDLGWSPRKVKSVLGRLIGDEFADYDDENEVVLIPKALSYQSPSKGNQVTGALRSVAEVPPSPLYAKFYAAARVHAEHLFPELPVPFEAASKALLSPSEEAPESLRSRPECSNSSSYSTVLGGEVLPASKPLPDRPPKPQSSAPPPPPDPDIAKAVGFYVDACRERGSDPPRELRKRIGAAAKSLIGDTTVNLDLLRLDLERLADKNASPSALPLIYQDVCREQGERDAG